MIYVIIQIKTTAVHNFLNLCGEEVRLALSLAASVCAKRVLSVIIPGNGT